MKKLLIGMVLATVLGSAAFAQSYNAGFGTANIAPVQGSLEQGYGAYAQQEPKSILQGAHASRAETSLNQPYGVSGGEGWYSQDSW